MFMMVYKKKLQHNTIEAQQQQSAEEKNKW